MKDENFVIRHYAGKVEYNSNDLFSKNTDKVRTNRKCKMLYIYIYTHICMYLYMYVCIYICMYDLYMYLCIYVYMYVCMSKRDHKFYQLKKDLDTLTILMRRFQTN